MISNRPVSVVRNLGGMTFACRFVCILLDGRVVVLSGRPSRRCAVGSSCMHAVCGRLALAWLITLPPLQLPVSLTRERRQLSDKERHCPWLGKYTPLFVFLCLQNKLLFLLSRQP